MTWSLQALNPELNAEIVNIGNSTVVGRQQDVDLVIQASEVSRRHAQLQLQHDTLWVQDLNSANGTYVNDQRIDTLTQLTDGDIVQFAGYKFKVLAPADLPESVTEANILPESVALEGSGNIVPENVVPNTAPLSAPDRTAAHAEHTEPAFNADGLPQPTVTPKPAPIAAETLAQIQSAQATATPVQHQPNAASKQSTPMLDPQPSQQQNAKIGLWALLLLLIIASVLGFYFY